MGCYGQGGIRILAQGEELNQRLRLMFYKLLDRAPLRFAPRSTVLPAWLAPLAAKRSVALLPHNATGHTWSQLVTDCYKFHTEWNS